MEPRTIISALRCQRQRPHPHRQRLSLTVGGGLVRHHLSPAPSGGGAPPPQLRRLHHHRGNISPAASNCEFNIAENAFALTCSRPHHSSGGILKTGSGELS
jgi:hypothetical protein